jgi:hypothetical protein
MPMLKRILNKLKRDFLPFNIEPTSIMNMKSPKQYQEDLRNLKDKYKGKRCFVLGNGPSLNKCDLTLLKEECSFAVNGIFYKTDEMGYKPNFYMVEDNHVISDNLEEINAYKCDYKFFPAHHRNEVKPDEVTTFIPSDFGFYRQGHPSFCIPRFSKDIAEVIYAGQSVTMMQLQLAYHLGFSEVYLIGMDFNYDLPASTVVDGVNYTSQEDDPNHFHPDYFGKGKKWHDPKLDRVLKNYEECKTNFEEDGRKIYNATVGGKLELFERVDYQKLFH